MRKYRWVKRFTAVLLVCAIISGVYTICFAQEDPSKGTGGLNGIATELQAQVQSMVKQLPRKQDKDRKMVYLTFDDGPHAGTSKLLDVLDREGVKATFFVTAQFLSEDALIKSIKEIHDRGHEVAVHTYSHDYDTIYQSVDAYVADYQSMDRIIEKATGKKSTIFRFPGGSNAGYNASIRSSLIARMNELGVTYYDWNAYDGDCDGYSGQALIDKTVTESSYTNQSIVLLHDTPGKETVVESLPAIIKQLKQQGYEFDVLNQGVSPIQFVY